MSLSATHSAWLLGQRPSLTLSPALLRSLLLVGCVAVAAAAAWLGQPDAYRHADPELAQLLQGMAVIKATLVLAAVSVLIWRLGLPIPQRTAIAYLVGAWLMAGANMLVWQLSFIPLAAALFHIGELALLVIAWRDHQRGHELRQRTA